MWELIEASFYRAPWGWGLLGTTCLALIRVWPKMKQLTTSEHEHIRQEYVDTIKRLEKKIDSMEKKLDLLAEENVGLKLQLAGMSRQHLSEQAAAIRQVPAIREAVQDVVKEGKRGNA